MYLQFEHFQYGPTPVAADACASRPGLAGGDFSPASIIG